MGHFVVVCEECIKGTKRVLATLDIRLVAREHVKVRIRVLDQHTYIFERECGKSHLLSDLLRWLSQHSSQAGIARKPAKK